MRARWILTIIPPVALTLACAAPQEEVESPEGPAKDETAAEAAEDEAEPEESEEAEEAEEAGPEGRDGPPAAELLTATDVAFDFDFNASAMKEKYEKQCEPLAKDDPRYFELVQPFFFGARVVVYCTAAQERTGYAALCALLDAREARREARERGDFGAMLGAELRERAALADARAWLVQHGGNAARVDCYLASIR